jgi:two-component system, OmpR family, phosphate regulon response regulator PhoB
MGDGASVSAARLRTAIVVGQPQLARLLEYNLTSAGFLVELTAPNQLSLTDLRARPPDLLIFDWQLDSMRCLDVLELLRQWFAARYMPMIVIAPRAVDGDAERALDAGADHFVVLPLSIKELLARIDALLRRHARRAHADVLTAGDIELDREAACIRRRGQRVEVSPTDFRLIELFLSQPKRVFSRREILDSVWGGDETIDARTIDVHVGRIRKALLQGRRSDPITTVRGAGYRFDPK